MKGKNYDWSDLHDLYLVKQLTSFQIAELKGCERETIRVHLRDQSIPLRKELALIYPTKFDWSDLSELYNEKQLSTYEIAELKGCRPCTVLERMRKEGITTRSSRMGSSLAFRKGYTKMKSGAIHPRWMGGQHLDHGYRRVLQKDHPRSSVAGYVLEHILVWEKVHNRPLPKGWEIHHINGIKTDNRPINLLALSSRKHQLYISCLKQRIRGLEEENRLLKKALDDGQMIFSIGEN